MCVCICICISYVVSIHVSVFSFIRSGLLTIRSHEGSVEVFRDLPWILPSRPSQRSVIKGAQEDTATGSKFINHDLKRSLQGVCLWSKLFPSV